MLTLLIGCYPLLLMNPFSGLSWLRPECVHTQTEPEQEFGHTNSEFSESLPVLANQNRNSGSGSGSSCILQFRSYPTPSLILDPEYQIWRLSAEIWQKQKNYPRLSLKRVKNNKNNIMSFNCILKN